MLDQYNLRPTLQQAARCEAIDPRETPLDEAAFDYVMDAVGSKITRNQAFAAVKPGGVIMHIGLQDWASEIDMRKRTEGELRQAQEGLIHSEKMAALGRMSTAIVHEVSQPLAALDATLAVTWLRSHPRWQRIHYRRRP